MNSVTTAPRLVLLFPKKQSTILEARQISVAISKEGIMNQHLLPAAALIGLALAPQALAQFEPPLPAALVQIAAPRKIANKAVIRTYPIADMIARSPIADGVIGETRSSVDAKAMIGPAM